MENKKNTIVMDREIIFSKDGPCLISWCSDPICIYHFGGMKFVGEDLVEYEIVKQKEPGVSYAYLEISKDMKTGVLFDKEPLYNFHLDGYDSDGLKLKLGVIFNEGVSIEIPQTRLLMLKVKK